MQMPEAAMNENHLGAGLEDEIRTAWQVSSMKSESIAHAMH
jgi:hypothetical protein